MSDNCYVINIRAYMEKSETAYINETPHWDMLSGFSCPCNPAIEHFLLHNAVEFTKKASLSPIWYYLPKPQHWLVIFLLL